MEQKLQNLTDNFKKMLTPYGVDGKLKAVSVDSLMQYIHDYTHIWLYELKESQKIEHSKCYIDCKNLYISIGKNKKRTKPNPKEFAPISFSGSTIDGDCFPLFSGKTFLGNANFSDVTFNGDTDFSKSFFKQDAIFKRANFKGDVRFEEAIFKGEVSFKNLVETSQRMYFDQAYFLYAPNFEGSSKISSISFDDAHFGDGISALVKDRKDKANLLQEVQKFRVLRIMASGYRGHVDEAIFFAHELRARRKATKLFQKPHNKNWLETIETAFLRLLSSLYDRIAGYGLKPTRVFFVLLATNALITFIYGEPHFFNYAPKCDAETQTLSYCLKSSGLSQGYIPILLTLQNLFNPVSIVSEKSLIQLQSISIVLTSIFQVIMSYLLLTLFFISVRLRFIKGGGGGGDK